MLKLISSSLSATLLLLFCCCLLLRCCSGAEETAETTKKYIENFTRCHLRTGADFRLQRFTKQQLKKHAKHENPRCFVACGMEALGVVDRHGKLVGKQLMQSINSAIGIPFKNNVMELFEDCVDFEVSDDACEAAEQYKDCLFERGMMGSSKPAS